MEALKILVDMVKELPDMAIYIVLAYFIYKTLIIGSIYGAVKFVTKMIHDVMIVKKTQKKEIVEVEMRGAIDSITITHNLPALMVQIKRIRGIRKDSQYIHNQDIEFLCEAIDEKIESNKKEGK